MRNVLRHIDEVAHYWAHGRQESGRCAALSFNGPHLYSYNTVIAIRFPEGIVRTRLSYSITTSKHQSLAWRAAPGVVVSAPGALSTASTPLSIRAQWVAAVEEAAARYTQATRRPSKDKALREAAATVEAANEFCALFGFERFPDVDPEAMAILSAQKQEREAQAEALRAAAREADLVEVRADMEAWKAGGDVSPYRFYSFREECGDLLRMSTDGFRVETSQRVEVPIADVKRWLPTLLPLVQAGVAHTFDGLIIPTFGGFPVYRVEASGTLVVGCHRFLRVEIERFLNTLPSTP